MCLALAVASGWGLYHTRLGNVALLLLLLLVGALSCKMCLAFAIATAAVRLGAAVIVCGI